MPHSPERWKCGNRVAISKSRGKGGKPASGFPGFPWLVICTALPLLSDQLRSLLLFVSTAPKAVGFGAGLKNVSTVSDAIQQRFA